MSDRPKILIVEDESLIAIEIKRFVERNDYKVIDIVTNYDDAMECASQELPDILLLDINLGKRSKSGIEVAKDIQKMKNVPVIYLTAYSDKATIFEAAPTNPIGYVTKPYSQDTLRSTLLLATTKIRGSDSFMVELSLGYSFDLQALELFYNDEKVKLSKKEKQLVKILVEANNAIVATDILEGTLYPIEEEVEGKNINGALRGLIHRFRTKLEQNILESIHSYGFRIRRKF